MVPDSCLALHSSIKFILSWPSELLGGKAGTISQMVPSSHEVKCEVDSHICIILTSPFQKVIAFPPITEIAPNFCFPVLNL